MGIAGHGRMITSAKVLRFDMECLCIEQADELGLQIGIFAFGPLNISLQL